MLRGNAIIQIAKPNHSTFATSNNNSIRILGDLVCGGTLTITNAADAPVYGDIFKIFEAGTSAVTFTNFQLPALSIGLGWAVNRLPVDGTLRVVAGPMEIKVVASSDTSLRFKYLQLLGSITPSNRQPTSLHPEYGFPALV